MVSQKKRRREGTDTDQGEVKALRQENEELRQEIEGLKLRIAKFEAECRTPQEEDEDDEEEVKLPTEVWAIIAGKIKNNDVCCFALVSKQLREAQVLAGRELVTKPWSNFRYDVTYFTEDWCAYWSRKFIEDHTDPEVVKRVLYVAARHGYLRVFEEYWSQGPQEKLSTLWDEETCTWAAFGGHLEVIKWLRAKGCPWGTGTSSWAAERGHLEVLKWMRAQDPPCPWNWRVSSHAAREGHLEVLRWARSQGCPWGTSTSNWAAERGHLEVLQWMRAQDPSYPWYKEVCYYAAREGHLEVLRWARSQGCPWDGQALLAAAKGGHLEVLQWMLKKRCPYSKRKCREAAVKGGKRARKVLKWLDE